MTARKVGRVGAWIVERVVLALMVGGLLAAMLLVGLALTWAGR